MAEIAKLITQPHIIVEPHAGGTSVFFRNAPHLAHLHRTLADPFKAIEFAQAVWLDSQIPLVLMPLPLPGLAPAK